MTRPTKATELYAESESLQMMTSARKSQSFTSFATAPTITLANPSSICNGSNTGANIAYKLIDDDSYTTEYFEAGQEKMRRITNSSGIGSTANGTAASKVIIFES